MRRCRERERRVVGRRRGAIVGHGEALEPAAVITDFDRRPRQDFMLNRCTELPVGGTHTPTLEDRRVDGRRRERLSERWLLPWTALTVCRRVHEVALRDVVAVDAKTDAI